MWLNHASGNGAPVVRVIAVSTKHEEQQVALFCICYYDDGRPAAESKLLSPPSAIGSTIIYTASVTLEWLTIQFVSVA